MKFYDGCCSMDLQKHLQTEKTFQGHITKRSLNYFNLCQMAVNLIVFLVSKESHRDFTV